MNREVSLLLLFEVGVIYFIFVVIFIKGFELFEKKYFYYR